MGWRSPPPPIPAEGALQGTPPTLCPSLWAQGSEATQGTHRLQRFCQLGAEQDDVPAGRKVIEGGEEVPGVWGGRVQRAQHQAQGAPSTHGCPHLPQTC